jgi:hypothetical protein
MSAQIVNIADFVILIREVHYLSLSHVDKRDKLLPYMSTTASFLDLIFAR